MAEEEARELLHFKRNGELVKEDGKSIRERERERHQYS
jgi:hypothetical protein